MNINLIDTDALLKVPNVCKVVEYDETGEFITYLAVPVEAIKKAPAIDAVPVVRCKDCKFFEPGVLAIIPGAGVCTFCEMNFRMTFDYCSRGEMRNKDAAD